MTYFYGVTVDANTVQVDMDEKKSANWLVNAWSILIGSALPDNRVILIHDIELLHHDRDASHQNPAGI